MTTKMTADQVIQQIEHAFRDVQYPGDDKLVGKVEHVETLKLLIAFKGKHWKEITPEVILQHRFDLVRFIPEAFRFYLPSYMIASLRGEDRGEIVIHVVWSLDPDPDFQEDAGNWREEFLANMGGLSSKQKAAIKAFIKYYVERQVPHLIPADKRIQQFWEEYSE